MTVRVVWHPSCSLHDPGPGHPESPSRVEAILARLQSPSFRTPVEWHRAKPAEMGHLLAVHSQDHLERLRALAARGGGWLDADTGTNRHSLEAAIHAAGAAIDAARFALEGSAAFALVRPPGHHAARDRAMGFCLINNVVVAAYWALSVGLQRVLIIDWDVHHGNGTQSLVERDARIRYVSLHQWPLYPGTGLKEERGVGNVFNLPRPPGLPRDRYVTDLDAAVDRATSGWPPELILISAGFDGMAGDPLAGFTLEPSDYATWVANWRALGSPIASVLEGGYLPHRIAEAAAAHLAALA